MTLAQLRGLDVPALWAGLTAEQRADIGAAALAQELARRVAEDSSADTPSKDRQAAETMASEAGAYLAEVIAEAFPGIARQPP